MSKQTKLFGGVEEPKVLAKLELEKAKNLALQIEESIKLLCTKLELVGSIRRQKALVGDIDFVVVTTDSNWNKINATFQKTNILCSGKCLTKINYPVDGCLFQVDFYRATEQTFGIQELIRTGSAEHNMFLASYAIRLGMNLHYSKGLLKNGESIAGETEESVFKALGLSTIKPQEREVINGKPVWFDRV